MAAPTTSLPERIGGVRNWDYRYGWIRDVAYGVYALRRIGLRNEAGQFMDWAFTAARCSPQSVQAMYMLDGGRRLQEHLLDHLEGYRRSRPVRTGNAAATQLQLDAFGELLDCFHQWRRDGGAVTPTMWQCLRSQVDWLADNWERPDHGIWEVRRTPQRFTHSAAMSHVALDRGIRAAEEVGLSAPLERWRAERERTLRAVVEEAWSDEIGSIAQTLGGRDVDASLLALPLRRVVPATYPPMRSTILAIQERLGAGGGLLYRYLSPDGLPPGEGAFLVSSFWMVDCLAMLGQRDQAGELYEQLLGYRNDLGLLSEQIDPGTKELLGNFPQALSHIGVLGSAVNLARGEVPREP